uniref:Coiled-coil and C2 domain containing 2B n=2 Tax=Macaca TaxID=9539 RepID=Q95KJ1_MACFA|nr:hypothetical protein [Macaca fascicularis]
MSQSLRSSYCSMLRNVDARSVPGIPWLINEQKLFEWANEVRIDPNNPEYSDLMEFVMYMRLKGQDIPKYFRLEQLQDEFNFVSEEEMAKSKRFQLLQLRNAGQLDNFLLQQMPLHDTEIPDLLFQVFGFYLNMAYCMIKLTVCCFNPILIYFFFFKLIICRQISSLLYRH